MAHLSFKEYLHEKRNIIEQALPTYFEHKMIPIPLKESMCYSLQAGGKRLRPVLVLAMLDAFQKEPLIGLDVACAIEMVHTYSLIHDDLPAMDDDQLRRNLPTNHVKFGEATAILAGDGLLTFSFQVIAESKNIAPEMKVQLIQQFAKAAGPEGMVAGQIVDMEAEKRQVSLEELTYIHTHKTGDLLAFSIESGALLAGASEQQMKYIHQYARSLGLAFQIKDDILDVEGDEVTLGKHVGSDDEQEKSTYPKLLTLQGAKQTLYEYIEEAKQSIQKAKIHDQYLLNLADYVMTRNS
ncbi:polyprenyl synthetase family protein [Massilibacterium senegalense]|uniref:polyprenyl synthetase family protein n=1 Tax=Massilibacterium senegalense TaxID=1632858 RepID=UPI0007843A70|nr:farnesyl diphosphate synthase [Massilibacterium senegalense]